MTQPIRQKPLIERICEPHGISPFQDKETILREQEIIRTGEFSLQGRGTIIKYPSFSYKTISLPEGFEQAFQGRASDLQKIHRLCEIGQQDNIIPKLGELNGFLLTIASCIKIDSLSEEKWKDHFCFIATINAVKFFNESLYIHHQLKDCDIAKIADVINRFFDRFEALSGKEKHIKEIDSLLRSLIGLSSSQGDRDSNIFNYLGRSGRHFLYSEFMRYYENGRYGFAKTIFFYYIKFTPIEHFSQEPDKALVFKARGPLEEIFHSLEKKSYVPVNVVDVRQITRGIMTLIDIDLFILNFLHQFEEKVIKKSNQDSLNLDGTKIVDWSLLYACPPQYLTEKSEVYSELLSATSSAKLNSVGDMQITCKNQVEISTGIQRHIKIDQERQEQVQHTVAYENEVLARLKSLDKKDQANDQRIRDSIENIGERSFDADQLSEKRNHQSLSGEEIESQSIRANDKKNTQRSEINERAFEEGDRWQISQVEAKEDGVEITDTHRTSDELSTMSESSTKHTLQTVKDHDKGGGWSILGFISNRSRDKGSTTNKKEEGSVSREGRVFANEAETGRKDSHIQKTEETRSHDKQVQTSTQSQEAKSAALEIEEENQEDYRLTLLQRQELDQVNQSHNKLGVKKQGRKLEDSEINQKRVESFEDQIESGYSVRNKFNFENAKSILNYHSQEYTEDRLNKTVVESTETFCLKQGYLLISKAEYTRKMILTPVKFVIDFDYSLASDRVTRLQEEDLPPYLHSLRFRIHSIESRRFHIISPQIRIDASPVLTKNLALEVWNDDRASKDRANQLNITFHRLARFLDQVCDRISEQAWAEYHRHRNNYIEEASLKYCEDASRSLFSMFKAFEKEYAVCGDQQFLRLHSEFQNLTNQTAFFQRQLSPPNKDSGLLLHKEHAAGILLGQNQLTFEDSYKNLLVVGSVGCGKSSNVITPTLLQLENCSMLVSDVDGEIYKATSGIMEKKGFDVRVFNIQEGGLEGDHFNPLDDLTLDSYDNIRLIVNCIMKARGFDETKGEKDAFWVIGGKMILELALRLILKDKKEEKIQAVTLAALYEKVGSLTQKEIETFAQEKENEGHKVESVALKQMARSVISSGSSFSDRASYAKSAVDCFNSPIVQNLTQKSTIDLLEIRKKPTVIYLKISQKQLSQYQFLLSLFYTRFFSTCYQESNVGKSNTTRSLPVICLMDEFGHTPIPDFQTILTTNRKHEISVVAVVQSISQLKELYGEKNANTMLGGGFASKLYFALDISDVQIARDISDAYGKVIGKKGQTFEQTGMISHTEGEKEGLTIEEVMYPGMGYATFIHTGYKPIKIRLTPYFENARFHDLIHQKLDSTIALPSSSSLDTNLISKEEAIEAFISLLKERKNVNASMIKKFACTKKRSDFESFLSRQGILPTTQVRMHQLIDIIYAERTLLFKCPRFISLDQQSQESLKSCWEFAVNSSPSEAFDALVEILDLLYEKGFRPSEIIALKEVNDLISKVPNLGLFIIKDLALQYRLNKGKISRADILKGIETLNDGFSNEETEEYWKSLINYIHSLLEQTYHGKIERQLKSLLVLTAVEKLVDLYPSTRFPLQKLQFLKISHELKTFNDLTTLLRGNILMIKGKPWRITHVSIIGDSLVIRIDITHENVKKVIRFDQETGGFDIYENKQQ